MDELVLRQHNSISVYFSVPKQEVSQNRELHTVSRNYTSIFENYKKKKKRVSTEAGFNSYYKIAKEIEIRYCESTTSLFNGDIKRRRCERLRKPST